MPMDGLPGTGWRVSHRHTPQSHCRWGRRYADGAYLGLGGGCAIGILHNFVVDGGRHAYRSAREIGVEVLALSQLDARGRVAVAVQQVVDIVLATVPRT
jgi:hypothetical protein